MRKDRIGSYITFEDGDTEVEGKVVNRKTNGKVLVVCLSGRNAGNSKLLNPDDIISSSAAPDIQEMIESNGKYEHITEAVLQEGIFRDTYMLSDNQVKKVIDHLESEIDGFVTRKRDQVIWGFIKGDEEAIFKYIVPDGEMKADFSYRQLLRLTKSDL